MGKIEKILLYTSIIAAIMGTSLASMYSPTPENTSSYQAPAYNENHLLDKDHNLAVSFPEMLMGLGNHGFDAIGDYMRHTFFVRV